MQACPYCGKKHRKYPGECGAHVISKHMILCFMGPHKEGCLKEKFLSYAAEMFPETMVDTRRV